MGGCGPLGLPPTFEEAGNAAAFLASDQAGALTGTVANGARGSVAD